MEVGIEVEVTFKSRAFDDHRWRRSRPAHGHRRVGIALLRAARSHRVAGPGGKPTSLRAWRAGSARPDRARPGRRTVPRRNPVDALTARGAEHRSQAARGQGRRDRQPGPAVASDEPWSEARGELSGAGVFRSGSGSFLVGPESRMTRRGTSDIIGSRVRRPRWSCREGFAVRGNATRY